ncbi:MAG: type II CAAX endopeptidase family protein [Bacillota bacterium]|nr:type II CAAX endopeptidase family protein [Bacillota bacterium]
MKPVFRSNLFACILIFLYVFAGGFVLVRLHIPNYILIALAEVLFLLVPTIIYFYITKLSVINTLRLHKINIKSIGVVILIVACCFPIATFASLVTQLFFTNNTAKVMNSFMSLPLILLILITAVTPAVCEEVTMRGVVLSGYKNVDIKKAAIMNGLIFGLFHMNPDQFLYAFALGVIFAYIVDITNSIFSTMIAHFTFNGSQTVMAWLVIKFSPFLNQGTKTNAETSFSQYSLHLKVIMLSFSFAFAAGSVVLVVLLLKLLKSVNKDKIAEKYGNGFENNEDISENNEVGLLYNNYKPKKERVVNLPFILIVLLYIVYIGWHFSKFAA